MSKSKSFYSENEELDFESFNDFEYEFKDIQSNPPDLKESLIELFRNAGLSEKDAKNIYSHLHLKCNHIVEDKWDLIRKEYPRISKNDALTISSYT